MSQEQSYQSDEDLLVVLNHEPAQQRKQQVNSEARKTQEQPLPRKPVEQMDMSNFDCYPEINMKTREVLKSHGIETLFPI